MSLKCPQCRSTKVSKESILDSVVCQYCTTDFYPYSIREIQKAFSDATQVKLAQFKNPLTIQSVTQEEESSITVALSGNSGGEYRLVYQEDGSAYLRRRKSPSEMNQFGGSWNKINKNTQVQSLI